ncbi:ABC transporter substrate-binding protein [Malaciobacter pacificus]|uniref:Nitrate/sulfonate/bicarbonate ABC transporter, periplasmic substrate-binding protein n=1 Tax=Malaciobacter pacificus TaxID=1080223 RepID=A0A5C2H8I9_9BACT|nr:transporter substrate-binding domain-containing protein [Malaciobacter pacificus]QEP33536.1 nitrate/sulfonate/bicarbonate ABC transporter, periplasmic substrate-binding protein [Malaciobacter pacificus]GGD39411.1 ABC transporter substrate-binding protein [Malaciobacter pacificus]
MNKFLFTMLILTINLFGLDKIKVGVLAFGTVNWELDVIKTNGLDKKYNFDLEVVKLASKNATSIAFQSKSVDVFVTDWIWVNTQRERGNDFTYYPYSKANGTLYVPIDSKAKTLLDLSGKNIGVAGGPVDKTWLLLRAYSKLKYNKDLIDIVKPTFAAPPILMKKVLDGSLDGAINFWHFNAKLKAKGAKEFIDISNVFEELGVHSSIPMIGWTFRVEDIQKNEKLYKSFILATHEAKELLLSSNKEWERLKPLMNVKDEKTFEALKEGYKLGIVKELNEKSKKDLSKVFNILLKEGGERLMGSSKYLQDETFWNFKK